jgi:hypothetical protein
MKKTELTLKINTNGVMEELSQLNHLLKEADNLIDSISDKLKNLTVTPNTHQ